MITIIIAGIIQAFKNLEYDSLYPTTFTVNLPIIAVGGSASPSGQMTLIPARAIMGSKPILLNNKMSGTPRTGAAPYIKTASETGSTRNNVANTTATGKVTAVTASNPRTPVSVMICHTG